MIMYNVLDPGHYSHIINSVSLASRFPGYKLHGIVKWITVVCQLCFMPVPSAIELSAGDNGAGMQGLARGYGTVEFRTNTGGLEWGDVAGDPAHALAGLDAPLFLDMSGSLGHGAGRGRGLRARNQ